MVVDLCVVVEGKVDNVDYVRFFGCGVDCIRSYGK